jgi:hypothetical protein
MQIVINIGKKHFYAIMLAMCLLGGGFVVAYNSNGEGGVPSIMGHSFDETSGGLASLGNVNCDVDVPGACSTGLPGMAIKGQPTTGHTLLTIKDESPTIPGGNALEVFGSVNFGKSLTGDSGVYMMEVLDNVPQSDGSYPLCITYNTWANDHGRIVPC